MLKIDDVSRETQNKIDIYKRLLTSWNPKINLVSPYTINDLDNRHILDALAVYSYINQREITSESGYIDVGSGNGIPGIILALFFPGNVTLIESDARKCSFLQQVKHDLNIDVDIKCERIENAIIEKHNIVISRAFASIKKTAELVSRETFSPRMILLKGKKHMDEIAELRQTFGYIYDRTYYTDERVIIDIQVDKGSQS